MRLNSAPFAVGDETLTASGKTPDGIGGQFNGPIERALTSYGMAAAPRLPITILPRRILDSNLHLEIPPTRPDLSTIEF
jgi:hypothetical protein